MKSPIVSSSVVVCLSVAIAAVFLLTLASPTPAYAAVGAEVKGTVDDGVAYIEKNFGVKTHYSLENVFTGGYGEHALIAYAHMKVKHDPDSSVVAQGVRSALTIAAQLGGRDNEGHESKLVYAASVSVLLLAEVDRVKYRKQLQVFEQYFRRVQYRNGAYGYPGMQQGDISQTQYAMLALWTLDRAGFRVDYPGVQRTVSWLLRVQDTGGGWPYTAKDPGGPKRISQGGVTPSMAVAGGSALLIAADILRAWGEQESQFNPNIKGLPKGVKLFVEGMDNIAVKRPKVDSEAILAAIRDCDAYLSKNSPNPAEKNSSWPYYQLYTLERYESFKEIALKKKPAHSPPWFKAGVGYLKEQKKGLGWGARSYTTAPVTSSFALLFLIRSTQQAIEQTQQGMLAGGFGLPDDTTSIRVDGTQIKGEPVAEAVTDLLDMLEGEDPNALEGKSLPEDMKLATEPKARKAQIDRLIRLVRGSSSWQARRVAARLLGQSDEMRVVPALIFALDDPDTVVRTYARDGLRFISRKFEGFGMEIQPGEKQDYGELRRAQRLWREWYLTMDPGYIFVSN
ncbi:HEAT repeat domain-containing protein [Rhodopirellula sallentina]|uniref:Putative secreted protein n=1 Tax=Rhodopirellula sallentina SM41 TaxID=1263870 RepID=M5TZS4_9BACT|nr:HEAT repeat domain-containing protein [Rhodopirellula sallentina]EMI54702.1 putative secreted protein [Rhodopirellula sallentina SM41]